jgi:hypothetical protein
MATAHLVCVLVMSLLLPAAQEETPVPTTNPELIEGPWEMTSASGIDGIFLSIVTGATGPTGREKFDWQTMDIRVYHREGGKETWGYFGTKDKATTESYNLQDDHSLTLFDGERLLIHFVDSTDIKPFDLDITFSLATRDWSGTWSRSGQKSEVVLKRPAPSSGVTPNVFVGDWIGESPPHFLPGSLHIRQSSDGVLCAWLDRTISGMDRTGLIHNDQRNGEWLKVNSATGAALILDTTNGTGPPSQFQGSLSEDHELLTGSWERPSGGGLSAPTTFRRSFPAARRRDVIQTVLHPQT